MYVIVDPEWLNTNYQKYPKKISSKPKLQLKIERYWGITKGILKFYRSYTSEFFLSRFSEKYNPVGNFKIKGLGPESSGFRKDGSFLYYGILFGLKESTDLEFNETLSRIKNKNKRFEIGEDPNPKGLSLLHKIKSKLLAGGKNILFILPPLAPTVYQEIAKNKEHYGYLFKLRKSSLFDVDFTDPSILDGSNDCEYIDGMHGSDVVYARMLNFISKSGRDISHGINEGAVFSLITKYESKTMIELDHYKLKPINPTLKRCNDSTSP